MLTKISYYHFKNATDKNSWEVNDLNLQSLNLIVGNNAVGKTRTINVISNLAKILLSQDPASNGCWDADFEFDKSKINYKLKLSNQVVEFEELTFNKKLVLKRNQIKTTIFSVSGEENIIHPPDDRVTLSVRRDKQDYPFFEQIYDWALNTITLHFSKTDPANILAPLNPQQKILLNMDATPTILERLDDESISNIVRNMRKVGYSIEDARSSISPNMPPNVKLIYIKEKGIPFPFSQEEFSSGLYRALGILAILEYLLKEKNEHTSCILIDDFGEGLDFGRAKMLAKLIIDKTKNSKIQLIMTSNHYFMMNSIDVEHWSILKRSNTTVKVMNYKNMKENFDNFIASGLNNFELLVTDFLTKK